MNEKFPYNFSELNGSKPSYSGDYLIELWGANGYGEDNETIGKGGYTSGVIKFTKKTTAYFDLSTFACLSTYLLSLCLRI